MMMHMIIWLIIKLIHLIISNRIWIEFEVTSLIHFCGTLVSFGMVSSDLGPKVEV